MTRVGVIGIGHGKFGRRSDATVQELAFEAKEAQRGEHRQRAVGRGERQRPAADPLVGVLERGVAEVEPRHHAPVALAAGERAGVRRAQRQRLVRRRGGDDAPRAVGERHRERGGGAQHVHDHGTGTADHGAGGREQHGDAHGPGG